MEKFFDELFEVTDLEEIVTALFYYKADMIDQDLQDEDFESANENFELLGKLLDLADENIDDEELIQEMRDSYNEFTEEFDNNDNNDNNDNKNIVLYDYNPN